MPGDLLCLDFESLARLDAPTAGTLELVSGPAGGGRSLRALVDKPVDGTKTALLDRVLSPQVPAVRIEAEVYLAAFPTSPEPDVAFLGVWAGSDAYPSHRIDLFRYPNELFAKIEPDVTPASLEHVFPIGRWMHLRMDASFANPGHVEVSTAPRGEPLQQRLSTDFTLPSAPTGPLRLILGLQHLNEGSPPVEIYYDIVRVTTL